MSLDGVADSQVICDRLLVPKFEVLLEPTRASCHVIRTRMYVATVSYGGSENFDVMLSDPFRVREDLCYSLWDSNFIDTEVGVRRNHRAAGKVDALPGKVSSKPALFSLEPLAKTSHRFLTRLRRNTW